MQQIKHCVSSSCNETLFTVKGRNMKPAKCVALGRMPLAFYEQSIVSVEFLEQTVNADAASHLLVLLQLQPTIEQVCIV